MPRRTAEQRLQLAEQLLRRASEQAQRLRRECAARERARAQRRARLIGAEVIRLAREREGFTRVLLFIVRRLETAGHGAAFAGWEPPAPRGTASGPSDEIRTE